MGYFTLELARLVGPTGRVVAVDVQPKMLARLKRRAAKAGLLARLDIRVAKPDSLGIDDASVADFALAFAVVHEVPDAGVVILRSGPRSEARREPSAGRAQGSRKIHSVSGRAAGSGASRPDSGWPAADQNGVRGSVEEEQKIDPTDGRLPVMDIAKMIAELRAEREQVEQAILVLERLAAGQGRRRRRPPKWMTRPPKWMTQAKRRGRPPGRKNKPK